MRLAIGDVVRDRNDMVIGTVASLDTNATRLVVIHVPGSTPRVTDARDLQIVARNSCPPTTLDRLLALFTLVVALLAAYVAARSVLGLGGSWLLTFMAALGGFTMFAVAYHWGLRLTGPRRIRI
ncbi:hypothetical protein AB0I66_26945 [Streptomyces sp. NPDC050439]|uniref:hypothetical protein n=1 Tax=unclassified Streptomyces TaxID=2593676 RepID=UPI00343DFD73